MNIVRNSYVQIGELKNKEKQLTLCNDCGDMQYKGFWYASSSRFAQSVNEEKDLIVRQQCPACKMLSKGVWVGQLRIKNVPQDLATAVFLVIRRAAEQDNIENPQHRVLDFTADDNGYKLTTTSRKMVRRIQRSVLETFENSEAKTVKKEQLSTTPIVDITFPLRKYFKQSIVK